MRRAISRSGRPRRMHSGRTLRFSKRNAGTSRSELAGGVAPGRGGQQRGPDGLQHCRFERGREGALLAGTHALPKGNQPRCGA